jgi:hypothetical protein
MVHRSWVRRKRFSSVGGFWPGKLWGLLRVAVGLWKKGVKTQKFHSPQKFVTVGSADNFSAWRRDFDQAVARAKIEQCISGIFQFRIRIGRFSSSRDNG